MGITIHFEGKLRDEASFRQVIQVAREYARALGWPAEELEEKETKLLRVRNEEEWDYVGPTRGVALYPHEDCEPIRLEFDKDLYVQEYTKTQFAGVEVHLWVIGFLKRVEPYFEKLHVEDEGEYWETNDLRVLQRHIDTCSRMIAEEARKTPNASTKVKLPSGRIIDLMN